MCRLTKDLLCIRPFARYAERRRAQARKGAAALANSFEGLPVRTLLRLTFQKQMFYGPCVPILFKAWFR
jgi:hypothetical protein